MDLKGQDYGYCNGRTTDQNTKGPNFKDFFSKAYKCKDYLNVCDVAESPRGNWTLGFKLNKDGQNIPANYFCTKRWNRGNLTAAIDKSLE